MFTSATGYIFSFGLSRRRHEPPFKPGGSVGALVGRPGFRAGFARIRARGRGRGSVGAACSSADIFTKPLERDTFRRLSSVLNGYRSYAQLLVDAPTASIATMLQKTSDYANQVYHSLADHDLARYV